MPTVGSKFKKTEMNRQFATKGQSKNKLKSTRTKQHIWFFADMQNYRTGNTKKPVPYFYREAIFFANAPIRMINLTD